MRRMNTFARLSGHASRLRPALLALPVIFSVLKAGAAGPPTSNSLVIHAGPGTNLISRMIYGQFSEHLGACIYGGIWVGEDSPIPNTRGIRNDVVAALRKIEVPVVRWPGGCFADEYHWKDGIGPRDQRPKMVNTTWGGVVENNHFGTHEFMDFCEQIGADPCVCGNVGSGTVQEMMEWVEYITSDGDSPMANLRRQNGRQQPWKLPYFCVGNESWGCGGNMRPEFYADNFRRYNTFVKNYGSNKVYRIASGASDGDTNWTTVLMAEAGGYMSGLSLHHYSLPIQTWSGSKGSATDFGEHQWFDTLNHTMDMEHLINEHSAIMDRYDPRRKVGLIVDEWGGWYDTEPGTNPHFLFQQNTMRDALIAGCNLNIFNNHCARVKGANIAQMVNVLQAMVLTDNEKMTVTPTYWVFEMYTPHHDAQLLPSELKCEDYAFGEERIPGVSASASRDNNGAIHVTLCNLNPSRAAGLDASFDGATPASVTGQILADTDMTAHNTFDQPDRVKPAAFDGAHLAGGGFSVVLPPMSVVALEFK
jgi:alpha-L-arabinofuranosidase